MNVDRALLSAALLLLPLAGCNATTARAPETPAAPTETASEATEPTTAAADATPLEATNDAPAIAAAAAPKRVPGDFVTFKFSGAFRKHPLTLTERVLAREGSVLTIDYTLEDGAKKDTLRVRYDESAVESPIVSVARLDGAKEIATTVDALDAMLEKTVLVADRNDALLKTENVTLPIGGKSLPATKAAFAVHVGKQVARMTVLRSDAFAWGDVGAEIATNDGKVLYRAEVVDAGSTKPAALASTSDDE